MKRQMLLADQFLAQVALPPHKRRRESVVSWKKIAHVASTIRAAKRFVLDDDASRYIGEMLDAVPEFVAHGQEFAIQPFKTMYVEMNPRPLWEAVNHKLVDADSDYRVGWLFDDGRVWTIAMAQDEDHNDIIPLLPMSYGLFRPWTLEQERKFCEEVNLSRTQIDAFLWGTAYDKLDDDDRRSFRINHSMRFEYENDRAGDLVEYRGQKYTRAHATIFASAAGDLRNVVATLMFLNRTSHARVETHVPEHRTLVNRKPSALLSHSVVRMSLRPEPRFYEAIAGEGKIWRREHDVRAHFCHDERARNSWCTEHDWSEYGVNQWRCMQCGGLRWRRREHRRGHRDKGRVTTTYEVTG